MKTMHEIVKAHRKQAFPDGQASMHIHARVVVLERALCNLIDAVEALATKDAEFPGRLHQAKTALLNAREVYPPTE